MRAANVKLIMNWGLIKSTNDVLFEITSCAFVICTKAEECHCSSDFVYYMQTEEQKVGRPGNKTIVYIQDVIMQPLCIVVIVVVMQEGKLSSRLQVNARLMLAV